MYPRILLLFAIAYSTAALADGSLVDVLQRAKAHDAVFQAARAERDAGAEAYPQARSLVLPTLSARAAHHEVNRDVRATPFSDRPASTTDTTDAPPRAPFTDRFASQTWAVELRQPIFNWAIPSALRQGRQQVAVSGLVFRTENTLLIHRSASKYVTFLNAAERLRFAKAERNALAQDLETAQVRYDVGETAITGLREAQAAHDLAETRVIEGERSLNEQREELARLTGHWYADLPTLEDELSLELPQPDNVQGWMDLADNYNSRIKIAALQKKIAKNQITRRKSSFIPRVDVVASLSDSDQEEFVFGTASRDKSIGLEANWTLFAGGRSLSELRESRALYRKSIATEDVEKRDVYILIRNSFNLVRSTIRRVEALDKALESGRIALEATTAGFEVGERTQADVLAARRNLYRALADRATARYQYLAAVLDLKLYAGTLSIDDLIRLDKVHTGPELPEQLAGAVIDRDTQTRALDGTSGEVDFKE